MKLLLLAQFVSEKHFSFYVLLIYQKCEEFVIEEITPSSLSPHTYAVSPLAISF